jgi:hypothetical protein
LGSHDRNYLSSLKRCGNYMYITSTELVGMRLEYRGGLCPTTSGIPRLAIPAEAYRAIYMQSWSQRLVVVMVVMVVVGQHLAISDSDQSHSTTHTDE